MDRGLFLFCFVCLSKAKEMSLTLACGKVESNELALTNLVYLNPQDFEKLFGKRTESLEKHYVEMVAKKRVFVARF